MKYANIIYNDLVNSLGTSLTFYCQGCSHHCEGCFSQQSWDFKGGKDFTEEVLNEMMGVVKIFNSGYDNLVLLGGEPFDNIDVCLKVAKSFKERFKDKKIWVYSGYTYEHIIQDEKKLELLQLCDTLIDGKFVQGLYDATLKFRGSSNQRLVSIQESLEKGELIKMII